MTTGQLAARVRRECLEADPAEATERYRRAVEDRRVILEPNESGTANLLGLNLPPDRAAAITRHINSVARSLRGGGETRTMDQLRADVYLDLLAGGRAGHMSGSGIVDVRVDLDTLTALADHPGELAGYGPVVADIARQVADGNADAEWHYAVTDTQTGQIIHNGITRRRPTAGQRRYVEARTPTCVFPGCRMPATACDLNHRIPWARGGPTAVTHLDPLCRHDHILHHRYGWSYIRFENGGFRWISRLGHSYTTGIPP